MTNGFDRLATPYRWMEYVTFGRALERCRFRFLNQFAGTERALVMGDGDGRFAAKLLQAAPHCHVDAVDASPGMLRALQARCGAEHRVITHCADLATELPPAVCARRYDLVATHFLLDCLTSAEVEALVGRVRPLLRPDALWVLSEFNIPSGPMRLPAMAIVCGLYAGFRVLTGLRTQHLPDHRSAMQRHGFTCSARATSLGGLLVSELWVLQLAEPEEPHS